MMKRILYLFILISLCVACQDDNSFSTASGLRLTFGEDTLKMDTVFSRSSSSTHAFWVYNNNDDGLRLKTVRLARRNQSGFRVNVDGLYLDNSNGSQVNDLEIRRKDSLLVFVELTPPETGQKGPQMVEDRLVFTLESGLEQHVVLRAWAWDAQRLTDLTISRDTVIETSVPLIVTGQLTVTEGTTLTLRNTTLYLHDQAGINVHGTLLAEHCLLRGDRLDWMFDYLPYDRISGQWGGIRIHETSTRNMLLDTEIRNATDAVVCDSAAIEEGVMRLTMTNCTVHNAKGFGIQANHASVLLDHCQLTNTLGHCISINGGTAVISYCTLGQFYPFSADRGLALYFHRPQSLHCEGSIVTGYAENVVSEISPEDNGKLLFTNSLLRSAKKDTTNVEAYKDIRWESPEDSVQGTKHFVKIDENNFVYDFHLDSLSTAKGLGCY